jgi:hypothetical protein
MTKRAPSVKALVKDLHITEDEAAIVRGLIKGTVDPETVEATARWIRQCFHRPSDSELIMHAIDATIGTHGVEAVGEAIDRRFTPAYSYCNAGDSYVGTIIRNNALGSYYIGDWATIAERCSNKEEYGATGISL